MLHEPSATVSSGSAAVRWQLLVAAAMGDAGDCALSRDPPIFSIATPPTPLQSPEPGNPEMPCRDQKTDFWGTPLGVQLRMIRANRFARIALRIARATKVLGSL